MKLATWNVNSLRVRLPRLLDWLAREQPDVVCLQETKVTDDLFPRAPIEQAGWRVVAHGQKTYNGVAILARAPIADVATGFGRTEFDAEARAIATRVDGVSVVNVYVPNGGEVGGPRYDFKLRWLTALREALEARHRATDALVVCGDFNVAPEDRDVHDPERWRGQILFSEPEKAALREVVGFGLRDALREKTEAGGIFTWWDYRAGAFHRGFGLRIDHVLLTAPMAARLAQVRVDRDMRKGTDPSDHAPVVAEFS